ncbi:TetR/AcrR family transcriptional regulator [Arthrobacter sp. H14]|uniref:TetR/AcrR family transcriptional regulator n=1 Tax=Arthrobacter sp. H14 TaxID=1312959 RepID=UPI00047D262E|nr:TetR/AcrR family transcriptional regulator [Arthrobacter sp. H14]
MPRITAPTNAEQRTSTRRRILTSFGALLFSHGLPGLTMTDVARHAGVGRTAVYNYFSDIEELLVAYALDETERFLADLKEDLGRVHNPVDKLSLFVRAQLEDLAKRHLPPGPAIRSVLSQESFAKLAAHVGELDALLQDILREGIDQGYLPENDVVELARLVHGSLGASAARGPDSKDPDQQRAEQISGTVRFIQAGVGARFDGDGEPIQVYETR